MRLDLKRGNMTQYKTKLEELQLDYQCDCDCYSPHQPVECQCQVAGADESVVPEHSLDAGTQIQL